MPHDAGRWDRKMPAFSAAIQSRVSPSHAVWSMPMVVTTATSGSRIWSRSCVQMGDRGQAGTDFWIRGFSSGNLSGLIPNRLRIA